MNTPFLDFRSCNGLQPVVSRFVKFDEDAFQSFGYFDAEPPDLIRVSNPHDDPIVLDVIDMVSLFRAAPPEIVQELFFKHFLDAEGFPFRMAEPCMDTGNTLFRGSTLSRPVTPAAAAVIAYINASADAHTMRMTLAGGDAMWLDNRTQFFAVTSEEPVEIGCAYTTQVGNDFVSMMEAADACV